MLQVVRGLERAKETKAICHRGVCATGELCPKEEDLNQSRGSGYTPEEVDLEQSFGGFALMER